MIVQKGVKIAFLERFTIGIGKPLSEPTNALKKRSGRILTAILNKSGNHTNKSP